MKSIAILTNILVFGLIALIVLKEIYRIEWRVHIFFFFETHFFSFTGNHIAL